MPVYEYRCGKCGHEFEEIQRITEDPIRKCPRCGKPAVERLISKTSFVLKGSGWYATDYGRKSSPDSSTASTPAKSNGGNGSSGGTDKSAPAPSSASAESSAADKAAESPAADKAAAKPATTSSS
jgi:putative FmdB family regulatory protein